MIYLGADHRGFQLKEEIKKFLAEKKYQFEDMGNFSYDPSDDYTDFAKLVAQKVSEKPEEHKGVLICGSGVGGDITANKFPPPKHPRKRDDTNFLSLPADEINFDLAKQIIETWLTTTFSNGEKYKRRIDKIE